MMAEEDWGTLLTKLVSLRENILDRNSLIVNVTADADLQSDLDKHVEEWSTRFSPKSKLVKEWDRGLRLPQQLQEGVAITTQVNYVVKALNLVESGDKVDGGFSVVSNALSSSYLWDHVRVAGGAYGSGCNVSSLSGRLIFSSYRDPNLE